MSKTRASAQGDKPAASVSSTTKYLIVFIGWERWHEDKFSVEQLKYCSFMHYKYEAITANRLHVV